MVRAGIAQARPAATDGTLVKKKFGSMRQCKLSYGQAPDGRQSGHKNPAPLAGRDGNAVDGAFGWLRLVLAAEHGVDLVHDDLFDRLSPVAKIAARVKVGRLFGKVAADFRRHGQAQIGIHVNFAHRVGSCVL